MLVGGDRLLAHQVESVPNVLAVVRDLALAWEAMAFAFPDRAALAIEEASDQSRTEA